MSPYFVGLARNVSPAPHPLLNLTYSLSVFSVYCTLPPLSEGLATNVKFHLPDIGGLYEGDLTRIGDDVKIISRFKLWDGDEEGRPL
jgi:hypothetical protein